MTHSPAALQPAPEALLMILNGPQKGKTYRVLSGRITIGRGPDNDIVIQDPKSSRNHVEIVKSPAGFEIRDLSDRNVITVNGQECKRAALDNNSVFELGDTQFRLSVPSPSMHPARANTARPVPVGTATGISAGTVSRAIPMGIPRSPPLGQSRGVYRRPQKSNSTLWIGLAVIGLIVWMALNKSPSKPVEPKTDDQALQAETQTLDKIKESASARPKGVSINDLGYNQAQQAYVSGFQDFRNGQYERAKASFQACLSLFPQHPLCTRYMGLAQRKFDEMVQYNMVYGKKYRDQGQYGPCASTFSNVMAMLKDPNNKRYQEAKANYEACAAHLEERF